MKVKIQYTVELDNIPREAAKLLPKSLDLTPEIEQIDDLLAEGNIVNALRLIDQTRKTLYNIDERLVDCVSILEGYLGAKSAPEQFRGETNDSTS